MYIGYILYYIYPSLNLHVFFLFNHVITIYLFYQLKKNIYVQKT